MDPHGIGFPGIRGEIAGPGVEQPAPSFVLGGSPWTLVAMPAPVRGMRATPAAGGPNPPSGAEDPDNDPRYACPNAGQGPCPGAMHCAGICAAIRGRMGESRRWGGPRRARRELRGQTVGRAGISARSRCCRAIPPGPGRSTRYPSPEAQVCGHAPGGSRVR